MVGYGFTILSETPCADPHAGCCGGWGLETPGYPIMPEMVMTVADHGIRDPFINTPLQYPAMPVEMTIE